MYFFFLPCTSSDAFPLLSILNDFIQIDKLVTYSQSLQSISYSNLDASSPSTKFLQMWNDFVFSKSECAEDGQLQDSNIKKRKREREETN